MKRSAFWMPLALLVVVAVLLALAVTRGSNPEAVASPLTGQAAPALDAPILDTTGKLSAESLKGKPHLVNFFASWCGPCAGENGILLGLAHRHEVEIIGIAMKDNAQPLEHYLEERGNPYDTVGLDETGRVAIDWGVSGVPETFAIDASGKIVDRYVGGLTEADAERLVKSLQPPK